MTPQTVTAEVVDRATILAIRGPMVVVVVATELLARTAASRIHLMPVLGEAWSGRQISPRWILAVAGAGAELIGRQAMEIPAAAVAEEVASCS